MNLKEIVRGVAPAIATALGGPMAGALTRKIAGAVLGREDARDDEIAAAIATGSPELIAKVKELENQFQLQMTELGLKVEELDAQDRINARAREIALKDRVPSVLAFGVMGSLVVVAVVLLFRGVPAENKESVFALLALLNTSVSIVLGYYFGSSRGSSAKDEVIRQQAAKG